MSRRLAVCCTVLALAATTFSMPVAAIHAGDLAVLVTDATGAPLADATIVISERTATTDRLGRALIEGVDSGMVAVTHPRFQPRTAHWTGTADRLRVALGASALRALHITGSLPGTAQWTSLLELADRTALNGVMLDMKDESGQVYPTWSGSAPAPAGLGQWDLQTVVDELHARDLSLVVRVVAFQDPRFAAVAPDSAVLDTRTGAPFTRRGLVFLDPSDTVARQYVRELALAACAGGVDEVQLDYIRFPDGLDSSLAFDAVDPTDAAARIATIAGFVGDLRADMPNGCRLGADVFGFVTSIDGDGGIGQDIGAMAAVTDVISPMVYPNHWSQGWFGYTVPADHPGGVVDASMSNAIERVGAAATLRPWLQDFGNYGAAEVRAQIDAADALGLGWMIWNATSEFQEAALPTDAEVISPTFLPAPVEETIPSSGFWDVSDGSTFTADVAWLAANGITQGCNPPWRDDFCPRRILTRAEAATLLVRALDLPPTTIDRFDDDTASTHEANINALAAAGITRGCGATTFCPREALSRAQMASLMARALSLPAAGGDTFVDDDESSHEDDIERLAAAGITRGCGPERYCPTESVTREQVAAFIHRALAETQEVTNDPQY